MLLRGVTGTHAIVRLLLPASLQTRKQTAPSASTYLQVFRSAAASGGGVVRGVMLRGLGTKVAASAANGVLFSVLRNWAQDRMLPPLPRVAPASC